LQREKERKTERERERENENGKLQDEKLYVKLTPLIPLRLFHQTDGHGVIYHILLITN
jgi:hypothetical protein